MNHTITMLHESEDLQIYKCKCCNHYNLNYHNLFLTFTRREFRGFLSILKKLKPENFTCIHPQGPKAIISHSKFSGGMGFTQREATCLIEQIQQALMMEEVNKALTQ